MEITNYTENELLSKFNVKCDENTDTELFVSIMNGNFNKDIDETIDANILFNIGKYYQIIKEPSDYNYDMMKKCYMMAINAPHNNGHAHAMNNLGYHYYEIEKDYQNAIKYYMMAINASHNKGSDVQKSRAYNNIGIYYDEIEKDYQNAIKYYMMAINTSHNKGNDFQKSRAYNNLGIYYYKCQDSQNALMYFKMSDLHSRPVNKEEECFICYENKQMYYTHCKIHYICSDCSIKLVSELCPMCRQ
jgi:tetratricopeptide (TPR) repeat protein